MKNNILLTGATGFLGRYLLRLILDNENSDVYLLTRGKNKVDVEQRISMLMEQIYKNSFSSKLCRRIKVIKGDQSINHLGLEGREISKLTRDINQIYHCAAVTGFKIPLEEARRINVRGTKNILDFARSCPNLRKVNYISTTFIVGNKSGIFSEDCSINQQQNFNNTYEQTKFESELLIDKYRNKNLKVAIFRPSIITGEYESGETSSFGIIYAVLRLLSLELFDEIPVNRDTIHNLIPVDIAAEAIYTLSKNEDEKMRNIYHVISPQNAIFGHFMDMASDFFHYKNPKFIPLEKFDITKLSPVQKTLLNPFINYFNYKAIFTSYKTEAQLRKYNFTYKEINDDFFLRIFNFCAKSGFITTQK
jgi:thioester reductase-like protein